MVKIQTAEPGDTRIQLWSKGRGQSETGRRLKITQKNKYEKMSTIYDNKQKNNN